jgi:hypothetical protein
LKIRVQPRFQMQNTIVFKPGPVQGPGSGFWPGQSLFLKKIQNGVVLVKKKINGLQPGFVGSTESPGYDFFYFLSSTRPGSSPGSAGSRVDPPIRVSKLCKLLKDLLVFLLLINCSVNLYSISDSASHSVYSCPKYFRVADLRLLGL